MDKKKAYKADFKEFDKEDNVNKEKVQASNIEILKNLDVNLTVEFASREIRFENVLNLSVGKIIDLNKKTNEPLDVLINGKKVARGEIVLIDDDFSIKITEIVKQKTNKAKQ